MIFQVSKRACFVVALPQNKDRIDSFGITLSFNTYIEKKNNSKLFISTLTDYNKIFPECLSTRTIIQHHGLSWQREIQKTYNIQNDPKEERHE